MAHRRIRIEKLLQIISQKGQFKTGINVYNKTGELLLERDYLVNSADLLLKIKAAGLLELPFHPERGGIWGQNGVQISLTTSTQKTPKISDVEYRIKEITQLKKDAVIKFEKAKENIKKVLLDIKSTGGEFDYGVVDDTVTELLDFLSIESSAFSHLTREIFSYDDYLYNHSINVCTIATPVIKKFFKDFGDTLNFNKADHLQEIAIGYFMHDVGKVLVPDQILNKKGRLTPEEFEVVKKHSYELGPEILQKNKLSNPYIKNSVEFHHAALFTNEERCYPARDDVDSMPFYVMVCKLADIYDALTSKRCYKDAINPIEVVSDLFRKYAKKSKRLQYVLHSFTSTIGIYPPGSIVFLTNGQNAYIMDSHGPIIIPFTDTRGEVLPNAVDPIDLQKQDASAPFLRIDSKRPMKSPLEAYHQMPAYLKHLIVSS